MSIEFKIIATEISVKCTQMNKIAKKNKKLQGVPYLGVVKWEWPKVLEEPVLLQVLLLAEPHFWVGLQRVLKLLL